MAPTVAAEEAVMCGKRQLQDMPMHPEPHKVTALPGHHKLAKQGLGAMALKCPNEIHLRKAQTAIWPHLGA